MLTHNDLDGLRRHGKHLTGLDPLFDSTEGGRMDMAEISDETVAKDYVFGQLVTTTLGNRERRRNK